MTLHVTVAFGPSASANFRRAVEYSERFASIHEDLGDGRYRGIFRLDGDDPPAFAHCARLVNFTEHWRSTDVEVRGTPEVPYVVTGMCFCAQSYARSFGECRYDFFSGPLPKCRACPLYPGSPADHGQERPAVHYVENYAINDPPAPTPELGPG